MNRLHRPGNRPRNPTRTEPTHVAARPDIHIDIRELSLQGFSPGERQRFTQALVEALGRQATTRQDRTAWTAPGLRALPTLQVHAGDTVEDSAHRLARALFAHLAPKPVERGHG